MQPSYVDRINRAIDHVLAHLGSPVRLDEVAAVAGLSPFHFHRIFHHSTGESLARFVTRLRLERALRLLIHDRSAMVGHTDHQTADDGWNWAHYTLGCHLAGLRMTAANGRVYCFAKD